ncbi:MAG TPA: MFS transporter [Syntrophobacteraceae bacterium]|nr:MFS transporter [Syntrophobacteraceae bacterium]
MEEPKRLYTFEFISLCFVSFFGFCNMSVFYSFFSYLGRIGIPEEWRGFLVGLEPMSAFALKLAIIPLLHMGNAARAMLIALLMTIVALCSYTLAVTVPALIILRIFHGAAFVLLVSAAMAFAAHLIPRERSAQGFGILSITATLPYAVMPLVTEALLPYVKNESTIYAGVSVLAVPGIIVLCVLRKRMGALFAGVHASLARRPSLDELRRNLKLPAVVLILAVSLILYFGNATLFFFVKGYFKEIGTANAGHFFTASTLVMIAVRALGGRLMDKADKVKTMAFFTFLLVPWFMAFGYLRSPMPFILLAACFGLCAGIVFPMLSSAMLQASPAQLRGLNTNLALFMMDTSFFLSPYAAGMLFAGGGSFEDLFHICSGLLALAVCLLVALGRLDWQSKYWQCTP